MRLTNMGTRNKVWNITVAAKDEEEAMAEAVG